MFSFLKELRERKVGQVAVVYLVGGWLLIQVADVIFPALGLAAWTVTLVAALLIVGFPIALILAWAYELTPDGIRLEQKAISGCLPVLPASLSKARMPTSRQWPKN